MSQRLSYQDNISYTFYRVKRLLKEEVLKPNCQRELYEERVEGFKELMEDNRFIFINPLIFCRYQSKLYIVDGQHRYEGLKKVSETGIKRLNDNGIIIPICIIDCINEEEIKISYENINDQFSLLMREPDALPYLKWSKFISNKLGKRFHYFFSPKVKCHVPNMNRNRLEHQILSFLEQTNIPSQEFLYSRIILLNETLSKNNNFKQKILEKIYKKKGEKCFLGGYKNYTWFNKLNLKPFKIPKTTRDTCFETFKNNGKCWCCNLEPISKKSHHCGHIIADSFGGKVSSFNLRPICMNCNVSMGNTSMFEYMKNKGYDLEKANQIENEYKDNPKRFQFV